MDFLSETIRKYFPTPETHFVERGQVLFEIPNDLMKDIRDFDVILYRVHDKEDFLGNVISEITSSPYSHATLNISNGYVISADGGGVGYDDVLTSSYNVVVDIMRLNRELTDEEKTGLITKAKEQLLKPYNYFNLINFPYLTEQQVLQFGGGTSFICAQLVSYLFKYIDIDLISNKEEVKEAPCDIGRSDILNYVGTYSFGKKLEQNYRNEFIADYENELAEFVAHFMGLFSNVDEFYKAAAESKTLFAGRD
jgi:hypothetical protein